MPTLRLEQHTLLLALLLLDTHHLLPATLPRITLLLPKSKIKAILSLFCQVYVAETQPSWKPPLDLSNFPLSALIFQRGDVVFVLWIFFRISRRVHLLSKEVIVVFGCTYY
jgi:hypothetical protein